LVLVSAWNPNASFSSITQTKLTASTSTTQLFFSTKSETAVKNNDDNMLTNKKKNDVTIVQNVQSSSIGFDYVEFSKAYPFANNLLVRRGADDE
jgi:hypothetical protein